MYCKGFINLIENMSHINVMRGCQAWKVLFVLHCIYYIQPSSSSALHSSEANSCTSLKPLLYYLLLHGGFRFFAFFEGTAIHSTFISYQVVDIKDEATKNDRNRDWNNSFPRSIIKPFPDVVIGTGGGKNSCGKNFR